MTTNCYVGPMTYWHNNPPAPFNPIYDPRAGDWQTLACADAKKAGVYALPLADRAAKIRAYYELRKSQGTPNRREVVAARELLSDC